MATSSYGCLSRAATLHSVDPSQHKSNLKITLVVCFHSKDFYISIFTLRPHYLHDDDDKITLKHSKEMTTSQKFNDTRFFHFEAFPQPSILRRANNFDRLRSFYHPSLECTPSPPPTQFKIL